MFQQNQELYHLASVHGILADSIALEKESLCEVEEDGACEPWGFEVEDIIPLNDSTAGFAHTSCDLDFLLSQTCPRMPVLSKCVLRPCKQYVVAWG